MPWTPNTISNLPSALAIASFCNIPYDFMARNNGEAVSKLSGLDHGAGVADAYCEDLDQYVATRWVLEFDICQREWGVGRFKDSCFVGFGREDMVVWF